MDAELVEDVLGVGQHIHQVRDRRALVAADIGDARLQQRLGDRQNAFAAENLPFAEPQILDFAGKGTFSHGGASEEYFRSKIISVKPVCRVARLERSESRDGLAAGRDPGFRSAQPGLRRSRRSHFRGA